MNLLYLPDPGQWAKTAISESPVVPRDTLNNSAASASQQQLSVAAENAPLRVLYGQVRIGPQIACVLGYNGGLVILAVWGEGECDSIPDLQIDDKALVAGVTFTHHLGTAGQGVDATLVAAFAQQSPPVIYTDTLANICYSVVYVPQGGSSGFPRLAATIKGRKVYTGSLVEHSDSPAWCLADFVTNFTYGAGRGVDYNSVAIVAADNAALVGTTITEKRRTLNIAIDTIQPTNQWLDTLRTYAACWTIPSDSGLKFVSDKASSVVASFSHTSGQIFSLTGLKKRGVQSTPTVLTVTYRDTSTNPHRDGTAIVYAAGVLLGTTQRRESQVSLPGVNRYSQAFREATERLNKLLLNDLSFTLGVFDEGLAIEVGDVIGVTHPVGLGAKQMRVMGVTGDYGRHTLSLVEYDPAVYNATVATAPTFTDTTLPNPAAPPAITGLVMTEEVFQLDNGNFSSRWRVTWDAVTYSYLRHYRAELYAGALLIHASSPEIAEWPTPAIQENVAYTVRIAAVSSIGSTGAWATQSGTALGKQLIPGNVPSVAAFEAGGRVYVSWLPALDVDIWRYEVRYGAVGVPWATAIMLDRVDALRLQSDQIPVGTWTIQVKAIDSVKQESALAATVNVVVTSDSNSFLINSYDQTAPTLTNMAEYSLARDDPARYFVSEDGVSIGTKLAGSLASFGAIMATYHASMTSEWLGEAEDFGLVLGGQWTGDATVEDISGAHTSYLGNSTTGSSYAYPAGLSQKLNARFARLKHEALTTATMLVTIPTQTIRLDAIPREEVGSGTSSAAGPVTITLTNSYVAVKKIVITPIGNTARFGVPDNIVLGATSSFDVYVFDDSGVKIASAFQYQFQGV